MADTQTSLYGLTLPEVGGSANTWGNKLNADLVAIDQLLARPAPKQSVVDPTTGVINLDLGSVAQLTPTQDVDLSVINVPGTSAITTFLWLYIQGGQTYNIGWPAGTLWLSGVEPDLTGHDLILFFTKDAGQNWFATHMGVLDLGSSSVQASQRADDLGRIKLTGGSQSGSVVAWATENYKQQLLHSASGTRITVSNWSGGNLHLTVNIELSTGGNPSDTAFVTIRKNGSGSLAEKVITGTNEWVEISADDDPQDGDYYEVVVNSTRLLFFTGTFSAFQAL